MWIDAPSVESTRPKQPRGAALALTLAAAAAILASGGCTSIAMKMAKGVAGRTVERELTLPSAADVDRYGQCLRVRGGVCPSPTPTQSEAVGAQAQRPVPFTTADFPKSQGPDKAARRPPVLGENQDRTLAEVGAAAAADVLRHPAQAQINALYSLLQGVPAEKLPEICTDGEPPTVHLDMKAFHEYRELFETATLLGGWDALAAELEHRNDGDNGPIAEYIRQYMRAYFRDGRFFQFSLTTQGLVQRVTDELKKTFLGLKDDDAQALAKKLLGDYLNANASGDVPIFGKLGSGGFVSRGGKGYQFPAVEAKLDPTADRKITVTKVDYVATGSDVLRVFLHALFDSEMGLPAVANATGTTVLMEPLPVNIPGASGFLSEDHFGEVEVFADRVEGLTAAAVGRVIRGVSWVSLNNEALATLIETAVGVTARKASEKVAWCWFSCGLHEDPSMRLYKDSAPNDDKRDTLVGLRSITVKVKVENVDHLIEP